jgi:hypothetical protein
MSLQECRREYRTPRIVRDGVGLGSGWPDCKRIGDVNWIFFMSETTKDNILGSKWLSLLAL